MKKIGILFLVFSILIFCFSGCQTVPDQMPNQTTVTPGNTTAVITTAAGNPEPTPPTVLYRLNKLAPADAIAGNSTEWKASLPSAIPQNGIAYQDLSSSVGMMRDAIIFENAAVLITTKEELDSYFYQNGSCPESVKGAYNELKDVDFSTQSILYITGWNSFSLNVSLDRIICHDGALLVSYVSQYDGGVQLTSMAQWSHILVIDKADLPASGEVNIYTCMNYPNITDPELSDLYPAYPENIRVPYRYVFEEIAE